MLNQLQHGGLSSCSTVIQVMHQRDKGLGCCLAAVLTQLVRDFADKRIGVTVLPVKRVKVPHHDTIAEFGGEGCNDLLIQAAIRRPHVARAHAQHAINCIGSALHFTDNLGVCQGGKVCVGVGVRGNHVAFIEGTSHDCSISWVAVNHGTNHKEGGFDVSSSQSIKNHVSDIGGSVVKGQGPGALDAAAAVHTTSIRIRVLNRVRHASAGRLRRIGMGSGSDG